MQVRAVFEANLLIIFHRTYLAGIDNNGCEFPVVGRDNRAYIIMKTGLRVTVAFLSGELREFDAGRVLVGEIHITADEVG